MTPKPEQTPREQLEEGRYSMESRLIYGKNVSRRWDFERHVIPPVSASTNFRFLSVAEGAAAFGDFAARASGEDRREFRYIYDRLDEPNKDLLEEHLAIADEGDQALVWGLLSQAGRGERTQGVVDGLEDAGLEVGLLLTAMGAAVMGLHTA